MNSTYKKISISIIWLTGIISFFRLSLEEFLLRISDYDVYRVINISLSDVLILMLITTLHYLLLKKVIFHLDVIKDRFKVLKYQRLSLLILILLSFGLYALIPSQFPAWIFFILLAGFCFFYLLYKNFVHHPILKLAFLVLFGAAINSSLIFWMHEESNEGKHLKYAQQLAEKRDALAENILLELLKNNKTIPAGMDKFEFWEKQWLKNDYLSSNYRIEIEENKLDSTESYYRPILAFAKTKIPIYKVNFPENYSLLLKPNINFRKSIYARHQPYKELKDLDNFHFAVIDKSKNILSNTHVFDPYILDFKLPPIGKGEKIELKNFDVLAYRHSNEIFVLIGEPLSEIQVWISNFAFMFTLLIGGALFIEILTILLLRKRPYSYWQDMPIQFRIQFVLIGLTCSLFFIIAVTTFAFLNQNNAAISTERMLYVSETVQNEVAQEKKQYGWGLDDFSVPFLTELADRKQCDIDFYNLDGHLIVSSFSSAANSQSPKITNSIINKIQRNNSLIIVEEQYTRETNKPYLRTYFGIFEKDKLKGMASVSSLKSEIGTSPYIPIVMNKLLNVYVFLLLISWGGGLLLIGLLTKPLELLANSLSRFKLGKENEKLNWKGDDAIGRLIVEYNKMVDKVELTTQELIQSEREGAWQIMAQQIAHEINNKLTPLRLNVQFLTRIIQGLNPQESETAQRITQKIIEKVDGISKIASQFRMFAKLDTPEVKPIELQFFLKQFLEEHEKQEGLQYVFNTELDNEQNPIINIDDGHFKEVLNNIIANAEQSIPNEIKGLIIIRLKTMEDNVLIEVEDNGKGIEDAVIENIFNPKFSITSSQTGLGLPLCKRIIEFYHGDLRFDTAIGKGTCFFLSVPCAQT